MSKIDEKYIDALDLFTVALEQIVETLKLQQKKADSVNEMLNNMPQDNLQQVVTDLKKVTVAGFKDLKNDNQTILKKIESIKQQKESGMFGSIEDPKNKNKIVDGIKVIMLIAGGVLAMGLAFKIIGKVDFTSVIALSAAMLMMSIAYSKVAEQKLKYIDILKVAAILPLMSLGLVASSFILSKTSTISFAQGLSLILIAGALGLASYLLLKSISKLDTKSLIFIPLLVVILPLIALGLVLSSHVLKGIQVLDPMQILAVGLVGLALGIATFAISLALKNLKNVTWKEMLMLPIMLPLIALGLVLSSVILKGFSPIKEPLELLKGSAVIGLAMLFFTPTIMLLGKMKLKDVMQGLLVVPILAYAIVLAANQFNYLPEKMRYPEWKWSLSVGLSMISFVPAILLLGKMKFADVVQGMIVMPFLAYSIVFIANKFSELPNSMKYPDWKWTLGAGLTLLTFGFLVFGIGYLASKYKNEFISGLLAIVGVAGAIWAVDMAISKGEYLLYPKTDWLIGTGLSILTFGLLVFGIGYLVSKFKPEFLEGLLGIVAIAGVIYFVDELISKGEYSKHPEIDWVIGTGLALGAFGLVAIGIGYLSKGPELAIGLLGIVGVAAAILAVDWLIKNGDYSKYPSINWAAGTSLSMLTFGLMAVALGFALVSGVGAIALAAGLVGILAVAGSMLAVDAIFNAGGNFTKYPPLEWALGVGGSLLAFSTAAMLAVGAGIATLIGSLFTGGEDPLVRIAKSMIEVSNVLQEGKWDGNYPKSEWALGVGTALALFAGATVIAGGVGLASKVFSFFSDDTDPLLTLVRSMVYISWQIQDGKWDGNYPSKEWSLGVGTALTLFAAVTVGSAASKFLSKVFSFFTGDKDPLVTLAKSMVDVSIQLQGGNWENYPKKDWIDGIKTLVEASKSIDDFKDLNLSLKDLDNFSKSMGYIVSAISQLNKMPIINSSMTENMKTVKDTLIQLAAGIDAFMYENDNSAFGIFKSVVGIGNKRSMLDILDFSKSIVNIVYAINILSTLKPMPNGVLTGFVEFMSNLKNLPEIPSLDTKSEAISKLAISFATLANSLGLVNANLKEFTTSYKELALINDSNFSNLNGVNSTLKIVHQSTDNQINVLSGIKSMSENLSTGKYKEDSGINEMNESEKQTQFYNDVADIKSLLYEFRDSIDKPTQSGSFYK